MYKNSLCRDSLPKEFNSVRGDFVSIIGLNPSVSKSNRSHIVIFIWFFFINQKYIPTYSPV